MDVTKEEKKIIPVMTNLSYTVILALQIVQDLKGVMVRLIVMHVQQQNMG